VTHHNTDTCTNLTLQVITLDDLMTWFPITFNSLRHNSWSLL